MKAYLRFRKKGSLFIRANSLYSKTFQDSFGYSAIFYSAKDGNLESLKTLLGLGADPDLVDNEG